MESNDWVTISEFPNYEIRRDGRIRNKKTLCERKVSPGKRGYYVVSLRKDGKMYLRTVHILLGRAFLHNPLNKPQINHIDGNKLNNSLSNIEWVTQRENNLHARATGLHKSDGDKPIGQYKNGVLVRTYKSVSEAARVNHYSRPMINGCISHRLFRGKPMQKYKGYEWRAI